MTQTKKEKLLLEMSKWNFGNIIFTIGIAIVIIGGLINFEANVQKIIIGTLIILGTTIGITNIKEKETISFLISTFLIILIMAPFITAAVHPQSGQAYPLSIFTFLVQAITQNNTISQIITNISNFFVALITPAAIIVAIKTIYKTAKD